MMLNAVTTPSTASRFLSAEPPWVPLVLILLLGLATAVGVSHGTVCQSPN